MSTIHDRSKIKSIWSQCAISLCNCKLIVFFLIPYPYFSVFDFIGLYTQKKKKISTDMIDCSLKFLKNQWASFLDSDVSLLFNLMLSISIYCVYCSFKFPLALKHGVCLMRTKWKTKNACQKYRNKYNSNQRLNWKIVKVKIVMNRPIIHFWIKDFEFYLFMRGK